MQIRKITVGRTYNLGNYESLRIDLEAELESFDSPEKAATILNAKLDTMKANLTDTQDDWIPDMADSSTC